jgi:hypothetical protein
MKSFDFYEFAGVLTPGAVVLYVVSRISPEVAPFIEGKDFTLGDLGLFVILAYVAGHLVQAFGNLVERALWKPLGGVPTNWLLQKRQELLSQKQLTALPEKVKNLTGVILDKPITDLSAKDWFPITRQIYAAVSVAGRAQRVDTFNGNYGMFRGIASAFILCAVFNMVVHWPQGWRVSLGLVIAGSLALIRMHRFGTHYARELFVQFLQLEKAKVTQ